MAKKTVCSDDEFLALFFKYGPTETARQLGVTLRQVFRRRAQIEKKLGKALVAPKHSGERETRIVAGYPKRLPFYIKTGVIIAGSDAHIWPGMPSTAVRALIYLIKLLKPVAIFLNGDVLDGARISRHGRIGFAQSPEVREELEAVEIILNEIRNAAGPECKLFWTLGNHDMRLETNLANKAGEYEGVKGTRLGDHFPHWTIAWAVWINDDHVMKHRIKGGVHAAHNNSIASGKHTTVGHLHSQKVTPYTVYPETWDGYPVTYYGTDLGTLNYIDGEHADYDEDNPKNHRSGGAVFTYVDGQMLQPELFSVVDRGVFQFRGQLIKI